jgi:zinc D-Ala-D-Ala carboxypeptidase
MKSLSDYRKRIEAILAELAISKHIIDDRGLTLMPEATELVLVEVDDLGRKQMLAAPAASAWFRLCSAAERAGVVLKAASAFRSVDRQVEIIRDKIVAGASVGTILTAVAPPGYSEHHTGCAVDVTTDGSIPMEIEFEETAAFRWLTENAATYGFSLSFPRNNRFGYQYEPWHWRFGGEKPHEV